MIDLAIDIIDNILIFLEALNGLNSRINAIIDTADSFLSLLKPVFWFLPFDYILVLLGIVILFENMRFFVALVRFIRSFLRF